MAAILMMAAIGGWAVYTQRLSYVITHGVSMLPNYSAGDLVILIKPDSYEIGDSAAYHGSNGGPEVLHRIIGGNAETGFVFKGDNNPSIDVDKPTADELVGREALHIPQAGRWLGPILSPTGLGMLGFLFVSGSKAAAKSRRDIPRGRRKKKVKGMAGGGGSWATAAAIFKAVSRLHPGLRALAAVTAVCGVIGLVLGVLGWMKPTTETVAGTGKAGESMTFAYSAEVPRSAAYDGTKVYSPDPIFRKLTSLVDLHLNYRGESGRIEVDARLSAQNGWHKSIQLSQQQQFTTNRYTGKVTLDLDAFDQRVKAAGEAIGADMGAITLAITARVRHGDGSTFEPQISLNLAPLLLTLTGGPGSLVVDQSSGTAGSTIRDRKISVVGYDLLTAAQARKYAVFLILAALVGAGIIAMMALGRVPLKNRAQIQRRYPHLLVPVEPMANPPGKPVVMVDTFPALVKLAEKYGQMILTWTRPDGSDDFVVRDEGITYRYRITAAQTTSAEGQDSGARQRRPDNSRPDGDISPVTETTPVPDPPVAPRLRTEPTAVQPAGEAAAELSSEAGESAKTDAPQKRTSPRKRATKTAATKTTTPTSRTALAKAAAKSADTEIAAGAGTRAKSPAKRTRPAAKAVPETKIVADSDQPTTPDFAEQVSAVIWASTATAETSSPPADAVPATPEEPGEGAGQREEQVTPATSDAVETTPAVEPLADSPAQPQAAESTGEGDEAEATANSEATEATENAEPAGAEANTGRSAQPETVVQSDQPDQPDQPESAEPAEPAPGPDLAAELDEPSREGLTESPQPDEPASKPEPDVTATTDPQAEPEIGAKHRAAPADQPEERQKPGRAQKRNSRRNARRRKALPDEPKPAPTERDEPAREVTEQKEPARELAEQKEPARELAEQEEPARELTGQEEARQEMTDLADRNQPIEGDAGLAGPAGGEPGITGSDAGHTDPHHEPIYDFLPPEKRPGADHGDDEIELESDLKDRRV